MTITVLDIRDQLKERWGLEFSRISHLINGLNSEAYISSDALVSETALSHRAVGQILQLLEPFLQQNDEGLQISPQHRAEISRLFPLDDAPPDPWEELARQHPVLPHLSTILSQRPGPDRHLDHVAATPLTALKRALFLSNQYDLSDASVLLLGDHDMTSIALALLEPSLALTVADIDERLLLFINDFNAEHGTSIRIFFTDLRVELPPGLHGQFDLVFTDPPYSEDGVGLFLQRAICALKERDFTRIILAYGYGEQQVSLGYKVQSVLHQLRLLNEAILPRFNRYTGAPSLGESSDLYILRPTRRSLAAARRQPYGSSIYTQGRSARESAYKHLPEPLLDGLHQRVSTWPVKRPLHVGYPLKSDARQTASPLTLTTYFQALREGDKSVLGHESAVINLYPDYGHYALHACLVTNATHLLLCAHQRVLADLFSHPTPLRELVECIFSLQVRLQEGNAAWVELIRQNTDSSDRHSALVRSILERRRARLNNAWREALISTLKADGITLSKNQARSCIAQTSLGALYAQQYIGEMPSTALAGLANDAKASLDAALSLNA